LRPLTEDFAEIVRGHQEMVFRTLARMLGGQEHVEDLAQEVFLRLYRALPLFQRRARLSTYLYRIVINVARDEWNRRGRPVNRAVSLSDPTAGWEDRLAHPGPAADRAIEQQQLWAIVQASLEHLSEGERASLVLYHQEDCSYEQIAEVLDLPIGTVRTHLHRGREKLTRLVRERMKHHEL
jgi:RNA polymerase sigma-70 factor (ECF subfamily)